VKGDRHCIIIIDMLNDFIGPKAALRCPGGRKSSPRSKAAGLCPRAKIQVVFLQEAHRRNDADFRVRPVHAVKGPGAPTSSMSFDPRRPEETMWSRNAGTAVSPTPIWICFLREEKVDTVVVTGTWTNVCVRSTASEALYHAYNVIAIADGCASASEEMHKAGLRDMALFAEILTADEYLKSWPHREGAGK